MSLTKRIVAVALIGILLFGAVFTGIKEGQITDFSEVTNGALSVPKQTLRLWYTDEALTDYVAAVAMEFYEDTDIRVIPVLKSGMEYLEQIYDASVQEIEYPDIYLISNDSLEKAYLSGTASMVRDEAGILKDENYPKAALNAVTYKENMVAYPFYYETSVFLYNKTYMDDIAKKAILEEQVEEAETLSQEEAADSIEVDVPKDQIDSKVTQILPRTIDEILVLADRYDAPENVDAFFKWDVADIFYNYFFVGNSINMGGAAGDNPTEIDIYNPLALESLKVYQAMNQFFAIDTTEVNYESVLQDFIDGKIVFSVVTTDAIQKIEDAKKDGTFAYEYGIETIPDINEKIQSTSMSVTNAVVVNGFSTQKEGANHFAKYLVYDGVKNLYTRAGKVATKKDVLYENEKVASAMKEYENSVPITKMVEASNFWVQLEICFTKVWNGESANEQLKALSEQILTQITGEAYSEAYIEEQPIEEPESVEYIDDEITTEE